MAGYNNRGYRRRGGVFLGSLFRGERFEGIPRGGLYRSRNGAILGVCRGFAEHFELSVFWVRFFTILLFVFTGFWPTGIIYFALAFLLKPEPVVPLSNMDEQEFYESYVRSKEMATDRIQRRYGSLERRLQRLEHAVTTPEFEWESRLNSK
jgi:phage shock protein C